jgi:hypothetical protein
MGLFGSILSGLGSIAKIAGPIIGLTGIGAPLGAAITAGGALASGAGGALNGGSNTGALTSQIPGAIASGIQNAQSVDASKKASDIAVQDWTDRQPLRTASNANLMAGVGTDPYNPYGRGNQTAGAAVSPGAANSGVLTNNPNGSAVTAANAALRGY